MKKMIRLTVDLEINEELDVPIETVSKNLLFYKDDAIDGFTVTTLIDGYDNTQDFFIKDMIYVGHEVVEAESIK
jgi:hypothetical protein